MQKCIQDAIRKNTRIIKLIYQSTYLDSDNGSGRMEKVGKGKEGRKEEKREQREKERDTERKRERAMYDTYTKMHIYNIQLQCISLTL